MTGVSRRAGIGFAVARELPASGARVAVQSWPPYDADQAWGSDPAGIDGVLDALGGTGDDLTHMEADFADPEAPERVMEQAVSRFGHVDVVVANHARSSRQALADVTAAELDLPWAVNARASVLLTRVFAARNDDRRPGGRMILFRAGRKGSGGRYRGGLLGPVRTWWPGDEEGGAGVRAVQPRGCAVAGGSGARSSVAQGSGGSGVRGIGGSVGVGVWEG
ncbi:SDR family oxidoreductase [Nonomuraea sp. NPDC052265]|uniref:SDR family oxidoreductase n=1 Tax=Nonomuraea sp. NPDC052265 TaxID=3364374 RepID=UPI0037C93449